MTLPASLPGWLLEPCGDAGPRGMTVQDRTRLIGQLLLVPTPPHRAQARWGFSGGAVERFRCRDVIVMAGLDPPCTCHQSRQIPTAFPAIARYPRSRPFGMLDGCPAIDIATRWRHVKTTFSRMMPPGEPRSALRGAKAERGIWQRRYWEHLIRDETDLRAHVDYIHINPVKHGHVTDARDWPHSSFHRYVERGMIAQDWACVPDRVRNGER